MDFEWTCDDGEDRQVSSDNVEIIEFSFVVYDAVAKKKACEGQHYCKNVRTPITAFCTELTGISDETLKDAGSIQDALAAFEQALNAEGLKGRPACAVTHGCADLELVLPQHCRAVGVPVPRVLHRYVDLRLATQWHLAAKGERGARAQTLRQICESMGVEMIGSEHCGLDDSWMVLLATQQLINAGAELRPVDFVEERSAFLAGQGWAEASLCLDGLPFCAVVAEVLPWIDKHVGCSLAADKLSVVLGLDGRPSGRAVVDFGSHKQASLALRKLGDGMVLVCGDSPATRSERLVLTRPLRREERELIAGPVGAGVAAGSVAPFPTDVDELRRSGRGRGACFDFQKGACTRGAACRYLHEMTPRRPCFDFVSGRCTRGDRCRYTHEATCGAP